MILYINSERRCNGLDQSITMCYVELLEFWTTESLCQDYSIARCAASSLTEPKLLCKKRMNKNIHLYSCIARRNLAWKTCKELNLNLLFYLYKEAIIVRVSLSVSNITEEVMDGFGWNFKSLEWNQEHVIPFWGWYRPPCRVEVVALLLPCHWSALWVYFVTIWKTCIILITLQKYLWLSV